MTVITMSRKELTRLRVLIDIADGRLSVTNAADLIGVGRRQVYRLLDAFRAGGPDGLISRKRGQPSNRALGMVFRETVLAIVRERYADFGPTLAAEKLSKLHGLDVGVETLRQWMIGAGLWVRRKDRLKRIHQPRPRRDCLGELVQIDGSEHWWFEDRGPQSTLLVKFTASAEPEGAGLEIAPGMSRFQTEEMRRLLDRIVELRRPIEHLLNGVQGRYSRASERWPASSTFTVRWVVQGETRQPKCEFPTCVARWISRARSERQPARWEITGLRTTEGCGSPIRSESKNIVSSMGWSKSPAKLQFDLTDEETLALLNLLTQTIETDRYPLSP